MRKQNPATKEFFDVKLQSKKLEAHANAGHILNGDAYLFGARPAAIAITVAHGAFAPREHAYGFDTRTRA